MPCITRKIQLNINDKDYKPVLKKLYEWEQYVFKASNFAATHLYFQNNIKEFFYFTDDFKVKLSNVEKDAEGVLLTSAQNSIYQMLSNKFKGEIPMDIICNVNNNITKTFKHLKKEYFAGKRSLSIYRKGVPIPFSSTSMRNIALDEQGKNYTFDLFGVPFKTFFGRDYSGNKIIFYRAIKGEYKLCNSSLKIEGKKLFLLAVFEFEKQNISLDPDIAIYAELDAEIPIKFKAGDKQYEIGNKEEYMYRRLQIQHGMKRAQINSRYNKGGKGRHKKMKSIDHYHLLEKNYIITRVHQYTSRLIDWCLKMNASKLVLVGQSEKEAEAKSDELLLRNWGYFGIKEKLKYKCEKYGIELVVE